MAFEKNLPDYYRNLEVHREASFEVIEKAYKALCLKYHPDSQPEKKQKWAHEKMCVLNEAYQVLSNPISREQYDERRKKIMWNIFLEEGLLGLAKMLVKNF